MTHFPLSTSTRIKLLALGLDWSASVQLLSTLVKKTNRHCELRTICPSSFPLNQVFSVFYFTLRQHFEVGVKRIVLTRSCWPEWASSAPVLQILFEVTAAFWDHNTILSRSFSKIILVSNYQIFQPRLFEVLQWSPIEWKLNMEAAWSSNPRSKNWRCLLMYQINVEPVVDGTWHIKQDPI